MKIAVVTDDGDVISQHFGRAAYYAVLTVEDGRVVDKEMREKPAHHHAPGVSHEGHHAGSGSDPAAEDIHQRMAAVIADCEAILTRGMGMGAYRSLSEAGIRPVVTDVASVEEAAIAYAEGRLADHPERLH